MDYYFLTLQNTYETVEVGLFSPAPALIASRTVTKMHASRELIPLVDQLLKDHSIALDNLPYIVVNQGPGPFTTLRVVISTVNGISLATGIPLIGIDALEAMRRQWQDTTYPCTAFIFNAFGFDVYALIEKKGTVIFKGCVAIDQLLVTLHQEKESIRFLGNGAHLYRDKITQVLETQAIIPESLPLYSSLEQIGIMGHVLWQGGNRGTNQLLPFYLKQHPVEGKNIISL
jgi:tRNA threonylcarbamoyl adenosine modification protein YeaZ